MWIDEDDEGIRLIDYGRPSLYCYVKEPSLPKL